MFYQQQLGAGSAQAALGGINAKFSEEYPRKGKLFCLGNMTKRPQTWQLLGILWVDDTRQMALF